MKVTPEHLTLIREAIESTGYADDESIRERYRRREIPRGNLVQDIDKRFRWDLYWAAARKNGGLPDSTNGYNDAHIDTALRAIVKPL
jgi:hypothetical protein